MNASVVDFNPSLRSAQHAFDQWRNNRTQRGTTPLALRRCAVALLEHHRAFHICRALGISSSALKQWSGEQPSSGASSLCPANNGESVDFVRLPDVEQVLATPVANTLIIELPNATVVRVRQAFTLDELFQAAARFGADTSSS
jgi:hypothetical protein